MTYTIIAAFIGLIAGVILIAAGIIIARNWMQRQNAADWSLE